jgi:pentatricopeptide repeat protein
MEQLSMVASTTSAAELVRIAWMEIAMASFAATVYFTLTGWLVQGKKVKSAKHQQNSGLCDQEPTAHQQIAKALRQGKVKDAIALLQQLPDFVNGCLPVNLAPRLLMAVAKSSKFDELIMEMRGFIGKIEARSLEAVVLEATKNKDVAAGRQLLAMSRILSLTKSTKALEAFAKLFSRDAACLRNLIEDSESPLPRPFAKQLVEACAALRDADLAVEVFEKVADSDAAMLRTIAEKAATAEAAGVCSKDAYVLSKDIRTLGKSGNLDDAVMAFENNKTITTNALMYNSIMDACIECGKPEKAMEYFSMARGSGFADAVSYNTAMKALLSQRQVDAAKGLFAELSEKGLSPTLASYHGFLNYHVSAGDMMSAWQVVKDMQTAGATASAITCSILLKGKLSSGTDINKILALADTIEPMDEVLFQSLAEACIRTGQLHLLTKYQAKLSEKGKSCALTAPIYGSMIKAYGHARDVKQVHVLWADMISQNVQPTAITLGCMVEALVANKCINDAWKLVKEMRREEVTRPLVNTVIYSTILKGFANAKEMGKVMALYEEMMTDGIQPNNITYNTILNAFAQCAEMHRVPALLEDMKKADPPLEPDIVTYSTIVKGYCKSGSLDRALEVVNDMQSGGELVADEMMYNSLLDGCAKEGRPNDALKLLDDMKKAGVPPSNYTLSMLVKLMGRCRRLNQAFSIIEDICRQYGLKVNIQVYTCLMQACFNNRQPAKAVALHDQIINEGLVPDEMTYSALVKGCLQAGLIEKAILLTKCAHGLARPKANGMPPGINARCVDDLISAMGPGTSEAKALVAELAGCKVGSSTSKGKGKGKGGSSMGGSTPPWRTDISKGDAKPPWRQQML